MSIRTSASKKALELAKYLRKEDPDYIYLKEVFRHLRKELEIKVVSSQRQKKKSIYRQKMRSKNIIKLYGNLKTCKIW